MPQASTSTLSTLDSTASAPAPNSDGSMPRDRVEGVRHSARLLEDLLLHEMTVGAQLDCGSARLDGDHRALDALAARVVDRPRFAAHVRDVAVFEIGDAARNRQQGRRVGREEMIVLADPDDERDCPARAPMMRPGSRVEITAIAYAPWNSATVLCTARSRSPPPASCQCEWTRCAITSESVCVTNV